MPHILTVGTDKSGRADTTPGPTTPNTPATRRLPTNALRPRPLRQVHTASTVTRTQRRSPMPSIRPTV